MICCGGCLPANHIICFYPAYLTLSVSSGGKCQIIELSGENINITYKHDGSQIAVGNKVCIFLVTPGLAHIYKKTELHYSAYAIAKDGLFYCHILWVYDLCKFSKYHTMTNSATHIIKQFFFSFFVHINSLHFFFISVRAAVFTLLNHAPVPLQYKVQLCA